MHRPSCQAVRLSGVILAAGLAGVWLPGAAGAESHWAFERLRRLEPPAAGGDWSDHPIDRFVADARGKRALVPVRRASPGVLLRRVYFDLIGLPPSPREQHEFAKRAAVDFESAFESVVDRLLASRHYGERWGRHWMDVVRYADTAGDNADYPVPEVHRYRDYIIDAFNRDLPYDQFVREQLAGDLIAQVEPQDRYADLITATGFLALSRRYGTGPYELWHLTLEDTIDTVGRALMGLTLRCARCHDHKADPVTTDDYYALYGIFKSTQFPWPGGEELHSMKRPREHFVPLVPDDQAAGPRARYQALLQELSAQIALLEKELEEVDEADQEPIRKRLAARQQHKQDAQRPGLPPELAGAYAVRDGEVADAAIHIRGEPSQPGETVARSGIAFLAAEPLKIPAGQSGRLQLARWITDPEHPLTARVMANRIWRHHFGRGIVSTPSNFGMSGARPTHPDLLDFLARQFIQSGWSVKSLHRLILTSKTWQLSSASHDQNARIDTGNEYYWQHRRRRLEAEAIRDAMLSVSDTLDREGPPPHPFPPIQEWNWTQHSQFKQRYRSSHRSVYLMTQRLQQHPFLALFDGPDTNTTTGKRTTATVTPQALYLMNSQELERISAALANRLTSTADDTEQRIALAYRLCYCRDATRFELARDQDYLRAAREALAGQENPTERALPGAWSSYAKILLTANEFFYVD